MEEQIAILKKTIEERLLPLVDRDYVFLDLPYHPNIGDSLIATAAIKLLKKVPYHCLYCSSGYTFDKRKISSDTLIIFNGGGNFGDLWRSYSVFRNMVINDHPENYFLILPQSVFYNNLKNLEEDVRVYSVCGKRMTICARDKDSFDFLKKNFVENNIILVPDLAFYTDKGLLKQKSGMGRELFLKREDKEVVPNSQYAIVPKAAEIHDWPTMERLLWVYREYLRVKRITNKMWYPIFFLHVEDIIKKKILLPYFLRNGIKFVNRYDVVYSTRLHVAILAVLLNKQVFFFDNSYHKNLSLYNTWLRDFPNIKFVH